MIVILFMGALLFFGGCAQNPVFHNPFHEEFKSLIFEKESKTKLSSLCDKGHKLSCALRGQSFHHGSLAIFQGASLNETASFVVTHSKSQNLQFYIRNKKSGEILKIKTQQQKTVDTSDWMLSQFLVTGLKSQFSYELIIGDSLSNLLDQRDFSTLASSSDSLHFIAVSCMRDDLPDQDKIWDQLISKKPHALFFLGDNSYLDLHLPKELQFLDQDQLFIRHMETRNRLKIFRAKQLIPIFSIWDDHDFGARDGGSDYPYKVESLQLFKSFFPMTKVKGSLEWGPGLARHLRLGEQNFYFLDNRSFRTQSSAKKESTHFGKLQERWLFSRLKKFSGVNWLISGDQFFGSHQPFESYERNHSKSFEGFLEKLRKIKNSFIFLSGDRHLSEIQKIPSSRIGFTAYEFTSSPIHSKVYPGSHRKYKSPYHLAGVDGTWNFMEFKTQKRPWGWKLQVDSWGLGEKAYFSRKINFQETQK